MPPQTNDERNGRAGESKLRMWTVSAGDKIPQRSGRVVRLRRSKNPAVVALVPRSAEGGGCWTWTPI